MLPRVTEILATVGLGPDFSSVPPAVLAAAQKRGTAVHEAIEALAYGYLETVDPEIEPYLDAYRRFVKESGHEAVASEVEVIHPAWQYVGHVDRIGWLQGRRVILDWKSTAALDVPAAGLQLAGYRLAWNALHPSETIDTTAAVELHADATYKFREINAAEHEQTFLAAVVVYRARKERGR